MGIIWFSLTQLRQLLLGFYKKSEIESNGPFLLRGKKRCHISLDLYCVALALKIFSSFQFTFTLLPLRGAVLECRACGIMVRKGERDVTGRVRSQGMERPEWCWTSHFTLQRAPSLPRPCWCWSSYFRRFNIGQHCCSKWIGKCSNMISTFPLTIASLDQGRGRR